MRIVFLLALVLLGYWYVDRNGLALGYPPFIPVFYWKYSGEARYSVRIAGVGEALKLKVGGELKEGWLHLGLLERPREVRTFSGHFQEEVRYPLPPGRYTLFFRLEKAKGWIRYDWVTTKFAP